MDERSSPVMTSNLPSVASIRLHRRAVKPPRCGASSESHYDRNDELLRPLEHADATTANAVESGGRSTLDLNHWSSLGELAANLAASSVFPFGG